MTARALQPPEVVTRRIDLALHMLALGASVFPLAQGSKQPLIPKARGGGGFLDAKPDPEMARTFLSNAGQPNYGLAFPDGSDIIVLDLDGGDGKGPGWREDWQALYERLGPPGLTYIVRTPSDGRHAYYHWRTDLYGPMPPGDEMLGWTVRKPWKGYLVGPGSVVDGKIYEPAGADHIADFCEAWSLAAIAEKGRPAVRASSSPTLTIKGPGLVKTGARHKYLRDQARHLVGIGLRGEALFAAIWDLNQQLREPKTEEDVRRAIGDAESKFEPDEVAEDGTVVTSGRSARVYAEDVELAMPASAPFPDQPAAVAFAGLAGEAIESLELLTSASRVGMLSVLLAAWGGLFGTRTTYHGDQPSVLFAVLIGETGRARKGTTTTAVWTALQHALLASGFIAVPLSTSRWDGLASGEALVRILAEAKGSDATKPVYGLIVEEEFERLLRRMRSSEGYQSTLDTYLRQAFDARMIQHLTAAKTLRVQPPYGVSILGNVTRETLRANVSPDMARSGFANRFLWMPIAERDVEVPGATPWRFADGIAGSLRGARDAWVGGQVIECDAAGLDLLNDYGQHLRDLSGMTGAMGARLHVIASRISLVHAAMDRSDVIDVGLVDRAIALTEYARAGLRWSFRDDIGDEDANALYSACLAAVPEGLSTRQAQAVVGRSGRFMAARDLLLENQLITLHKASTNVDKPHGGRPSIRLVAADPDRFERFVPRARTRLDGPDLETESRISDSRSTNPYKLPTNPVETVTNLSETSEPLPPAPEAPETSRIECHWYEDHRTEHRYDDKAGWYCLVCSPTAGAEPVA